MELIRPTRKQLPAYVDALESGWSPDNLRPEAAQEQIDAISRNADRFLDELDDRHAKGEPVILPDGSRVPRLPGIRRWMWQDGFCGSIGLRWKPGTEELPSHCSGHVGYSVVPWRRQQGIASAALVALLPEARKTGLRHIEITTDPDNQASIRVIERAGGFLVERFQQDVSLGGGVALRFRINLMFS
ncbi:MAG: GNAT family N-acetyltransferase [Pseudomonadota bacterium]